MRLWKHNRPKPVIGITGGIGAGKSTIGRLFGREGFSVIDSDQLAHEALQTPDVKKALHTWLGETIFDPDRTVNRRRLGAIVFADRLAIERLNGLLHPLVADRRARLMEAAMADSNVRGVVWDTPLLMEAGLAQDCDAVVFVKAGIDKRLERILPKRGWNREELEKREKLQFPLDKKAELADYCVDNSGDEASSLVQVRRVLSQLLTSDC